MTAPAPAPEHFPSLHQVRPPWLGLALPPLAWIGQIAVNYALVPALCRWDRGPLALQVVSALAVLVAAVGVGLSWYEWRHHGGSDVLSAGSGLGDRPRFMALWGLLLGSFLLALIVLQAVPSFVVPPCE